MTKFGILVLILILAGLSFSATCASKAYISSCLKCSFDTTGKMNQPCYEGYQNRGVGCLFAAYPLESIQYQSGNCPAIQACIDKLQECKGLYASGNDKLDCQTDAIDHCFSRADSCVADAVKHCSTPSPDSVADIAPPAAWCDGFFFFILPLLGAGFFTRTK